MVFSRERTSGQARQLLSACSGIPQAGIGADIAQHGPGLNGGKLIAVAEENDARVRRQRINQTRHHRQVNHRRFIHHQHIQVQRVTGVVAQTLATWLCAKQTVQRAGFIREKRKLIPG